MELSTKIVDKSNMPPWSSELCNLYWMLRYKRAFDTAARRRYYRKIQAEKKRLHEAGVDVEEVRLLCRYLANPRNQNAERRWQAYAQKLRSRP